MNSHLAGSFSASQGLTSTPTARHPPLTILSPIQHTQRVCTDPCDMFMAIGGVGAAHMVTKGDRSWHAAIISQRLHWCALPQASHLADPLFGSYHPSLAHQSPFYDGTIPR